MSVAVPVALRCRWEFRTSYVFAAGSRPIKNVHVCRDCNSWTANRPLYEKTVCPSKERRKGKSDRRDPEHVVRARR